MRLIFKNAEIFQRFITGVGPTAIGTNANSGINSGTNSSTTGTGTQAASGNGSGANPIGSKVQSRSYFYQFSGDLELLIVKLLV